MSQENVEITEGFENLRRAVEAWNREDLDAFLETWHPDCEWRPAFPRSLEGVGAVYRGREGIASGLELDSDWGAVITVRDGLAIRAWDWLDRNEALKAAGLSE
jgi:ketosteroid isomerase-like protein